MSETLEYIEAYFEKKLSEDEKLTFEQRCHHDQLFAGEVAFYVTAREAIRQNLLAEKQQLWSGVEYNAGSTVSAKAGPVKKMGFRKWFPYAAAACLAFAMAVYFLYPADTPGKLAGRYVEQKLMQLSQTMDGSTDSLQNGISFVKSGAYDSAVDLFTNLSKAHPENDEVKEYLGFTYLMKKDYDKALVEFDELSNKKLFSNPGVFLKAITLLRRDGKGDNGVAKKLLQQVVKENLDGSKEAGKLLERW